MSINSWLVNKFGVPGEMVQKPFNVEYISTGGNYTGTKMIGSNISEIIEKIFVDSKNHTVGRMVISPIVINEVCPFQLLGSHRI